MSIYSTLVSLRDDCGAVPENVKSKVYFECTVELRWIKHLWNHENMLETGVV